MYVNCDVVSARQIFLFVTLFTLELDALVLNKRTLVLYVVLL